MEIEFLHANKGDKTKKFDTKTQKGREELAKVLGETLGRGATEIFVERAGQRAYRLKGYDAKKDRLIVDVPRGRRNVTVTADPKKSKAVAVPRVAGGMS